MTTSVTLVCVGLCQSGKSTVLNEFAQKNVFQTGAGGATKKASKYSINTRNVIVHLIDTPGFEKVDHEAANLRYNQIIGCCSGKINGVILVIRPGSRKVQNYGYGLQLSVLSLLRVPLIVIVNGSEIGRRRNESSQQYSERRKVKLESLTNYSRRFMQEFGITGNKLFVSFNMDELESLGKDIISSLASQPMVESLGLLSWTQLQEQEAEKLISRVGSEPLPTSSSLSSQLSLENVENQSSIDIDVFSFDMFRRKLNIAVADGGDINESIPCDRSFCMAFEDIFEVDLDDAGGYEALLKKIDPDQTGIINQSKWQTFVNDYKKSKYTLIAYIASQTISLDRTSIIRNSGIGKISESDQAYFRRVFDAIDSDNNGSISHDEFVEAMAKLDIATTTQKDSKTNTSNLFKRADLDGDGTLSFDEFACLLVDARTGWGIARSLHDLTECSYRALDRLQNNYGIQLSANDVLDAEVTDENINEARHFLQLSDDSIPDFDKCEVPSCNLCFNILIFDLDLLKQVTQIVCKCLVDNFVERVKTELGIDGLANLIHVEHVAIDAIRIFVKACHNYSHSSNLTIDSISQSNINHLNSLRKAFWFVACNESMQDVYQVVQSNVTNDLSQKNDTLQSTSSQFAKAAGKEFAKAARTVVAEELLSVAVPIATAACSVM